MVQWVCAFACMSFSVWQFVCAHKKVTSLCALVWRCDNNILQYLYLHGLRSVCELFKWKGSRLLLPEWLVMSLVLFSIRSQFLVYEMNYFYVWVWLLLLFFSPYFFLLFDMFILLMPYSIPPPFCIVLFILLWRENYPAGCVWNVVIRLFCGVPW